MGLVGGMNLPDNMMLPLLSRSGTVHLCRPQDRPAEAGEEAVVHELGVRHAGRGYPVRRLSGGNVQKVLVGREIAAAPTVLMTAYAVRGLDINSSLYDL